MNFSPLILIYLIASISFILGLKMLSNPASARRGNQIAAAGMGLAIFGTIFLYSDQETYRLGNIGWIFAALLIGSVAGWLMAKKVKMTAMPEMVSLFNGMGGACAMLISVAEMHHIVSHSVSLSVAGKGIIFDPAINLTNATTLIMVAGLIIGSISFAGSVVAWGKLNGRIKDYSFRGQTWFNLVLLAVVLAFAVFVVNMLPSADGYITQRMVSFYYLLIPMALLYGVLFVMPMGGADMPVVISLLNSFTGIAAACAGFLYNNKAMLTGGILVGAAGTLLTVLMCRAMNRSLINVLIGSFGGAAKSSGNNNMHGNIKEIQKSDAAVVLAYASKVYVVPGYGLAVAQAQHVCHDLEKILTEKDIDVKYAIHPVAGRMPGHMNVLLAESDVAYEKLVEMEDANQEFGNTDVVLVLGANDVVNPAAKTDETSPISGMPHLDMEKAKMVIVNKRSMKPGYAGIENLLFYQPKTSMLFGDAKKVLQELVAEIKSL